MENKQRWELKSASHHLKPVIRIGRDGLSSGLVSETARCLEMHELIKVHVHEGDRNMRTELASRLAAETGAEIIHRIGKVFVLYRKRQGAPAELNPSEG